MFLKIFNILNGVIGTGLVWIMAKYFPKIMMEIYIDYMWIFYFALFGETYM